jgi:hypothetical protein
VAILNTTNNNDISAFLAIAYISHTHKVETTRAIVDLWDNIRQKVPIENKLDFISALLATGRIMDLKKEVGDEKFIATISELIKTISKDLQKRELGIEFNDGHFIIALITSAFISRTNEIETTNAIVEKFVHLVEKLKINDDIDKIASILTMGRLFEDKYMINNLDQIIDVYNIINDSIRKKIGTRQISQKDIGAAFLTNANVEISPRVEKIQNIIDMWHNFEKKLIIKDDMDYTVTLLTYGRIRDINVQFFVTDNIISEVKTSIRDHINSRD